MRPGTPVARRPPCDSPRTMVPALPVAGALRGHAPTNRALAGWTIAESTTVPIEESAAPVVVQERTPLRSSSPLGDARRMVRELPRDPETRSGEALSCGVAEQRTTALGERLSVRCRNALRNRRVDGLGKPFGYCEKQEHRCNSCPLPDTDRYVESQPKGSRRQATRPAQAPVFVSISR